MKNQIYFILCCLLFSACQDEGLAPQKQNNYLPLSVGNYWVYQVLRIDTLGNEELLAFNDTIKIESDTLIRGETYYKVKDIFFNIKHRTEYLRDSSGNVINSAGEIKFSAINFEDILYTWISGPAKLEFKMEEDLSEISVPLGKFECLNYKGKVSHVDTTLNYPIKYMNSYYSNNVGLIQSDISYFLSQTTRYERRLIDYYVQ